MISSGKGFFSLPLLIQLAFVLLFGGIGIVSNTDAGLLWQVPFAIALMVAARAFEFVNQKPIEPNAQTWREGSWFYIQVVALLFAIVLAAGASISIGLVAFLLVNPILFSNINPTIAKALSKRTANWPGSAIELFDQISAAEVVLLPKSLVMQHCSKTLHSVHVAHGVSDFTEHEALAIALGLTQTEMHSVTQGFAASAKARSVEAAALKDIREIPGIGVTGLIDSQNYLLGTASLLTSRNVNIAVQDLVAANSANEAGRSVLYLIRGSELLGYFELTEQLDESAEWLVYDLADAGKRVVLVTADATGVANVIAKQLAIEEVFAELTPQQRAELPAKLGGVVFEVTAGNYEQISTLVRLSKRIAGKRKLSSQIAGGYLALAFILPIIFGLFGIGLDEPATAALFSALAGVGLTLNSKALGK